jgi:lipopolysaccharide transport system permease protein
LTTKKYLHEITRRRDLIITLVVSDLKAQHKNTALGYIWWVLDPLLSVLVYYFLRIVLMGTGGENIAVFLTIGLVSWRWLSAVIAPSTNVISSEAALISKIYLPKFIFPLCLNIAQMINFAFSLVVVAIFLIIFETIPNHLIIWIPYIMLAQFLFLFAVSLILAYAGAFVKDLKNVIGHVLRFWFYGSPIIWEKTMLPESFTFLVDLNPAAAITNSFRNVMMYRQPPEFFKLTVIILCSIVLITFMLWFYNKNEHKIIKAL